MARKKQQPEEILEPEIVVEATEMIPIISRSYPTTAEALEQLKKDYQALDPNSPMYVDNAKDVLRRAIKVRTSTEKARLAINRRVTSTVNEEADRIKAVAQPIEDDLEKRLNDIALAEAARRQNNFDKAQKALLDAGFTFTGSSYTCDVRIIMPESLYEMPDDVLQEHCVFAADYQANMLAVQLAQKAEADRIAAEKKKLEDQNAELQRQLEEMRAQLAAAQPNAEPEPKPETEAQPEPESEPQSETETKSAPEPKPAPPTGNPFAGFSIKPSAEKSAVHTPNEDFLPPQTKAFNPTLTVPQNTTDPNDDEETETPAFSTHSELDKYSAAFDDGYECFRRQAIALFSKPEPKYTRAEWVTCFTNIDPSTKV